MTCVSATARCVCFPRFTFDFLHEYCVCAFVLGICSIEARDLLLTFVSVTRHVCATCQRRVDPRCCRSGFAFMVFCFALVGFCVYVFLFCFGVQEQSLVLEQALSHFAEARGQDIVCAAGDVVRTVDSRASAQTVMLKLCSTSTVMHSCEPLNRTPTF